MNCVNHPEVAAAAYCQSCGKPLCTSCMRTVGGVVYCEQCLAARLSSNAVTGNAVPNLHAHPVLAGLLGFIPGVGAMYNGQFVKALAHVLIFAVFVSLSDKSSIFGLLVAAWVFYQVFDAAQTAKARRDGLPLPNPFGLNDLGVRMGITPAQPPYTSGFSAAPPTPGQPAGQNPVSGATYQPPAYSTSYAAPPPPGTPFPESPANAGPVNADPSYNPVYGAGTGAGPGAGSGPVYSQTYGAGYGAPAAIESQANRYPLGAIVLIIIGLVLLLETLGIFEHEWISRGWPVILIAVGAWLLYRRTRDLPRGGSR